MRKISCLLLLISFLSFSQNKQILYGFAEIPQALLQNPGGIVKNDWYFGIPLVSHIHAQSGSSGVSTYDLFANDGVDFNLKLQRVVNRLKPTDFLALNQQLEILSGGFAFGASYNKNQYLSFGLYQETDFIAYFPKDLAILGLEGNARRINNPFQLNHASFKGEVLSVFHVGYNIRMDYGFTFGVRGKIYSSIFNMSSINNQGTFNTRTGVNNFFNQTFNLDVALQTSGLGGLIDENSEFSGNDIVKGTLLGGNLGLGIDLGFTYNITDQWTVDASVLDVGFVRHTKDVKNYNIEGVFEFEGINPLFPEITSGQTAVDYWNDIGEALVDLVEVDTTETSFTTGRPAKFNASLNYAFGRKKSKDCNCKQASNNYSNAVGLQWFAVTRPKQTQMALTAYYYKRLFKGLRLKGTYTIDSYSANNLGLGLSAHLGRANFYVMADNLLQYQNIYNAQSVSLQLGFNYIFNSNED